MISYDPTVAGNLKSLQRQINKLGSAPLGPVGVGPGDGHIRFYAADGRVLFQANSSGASVESRGGLTGLTPLLDSIRDKDDEQDGRLTAHDGTLASHGTRLGTAEGRLDGHDSTLASHNTRISNAQSRADDAHGDAATAQARADSAWTRAGTGISNAATAQARADNAHTRIDGLNYASPGDIATLSNQVQALRDQVHDWMQTARASNPDLPPPIPN